MSDAPTTEPTPTPTPAPVKRARHAAVVRGVQQARTVSAPDFTKPTGVLLALLVTNFAWTMYRTIVNNPTKLFHSALQSLAGLWVVGLGVLIVAEFNPQLALMFMVLVTIGNVLANNTINNRAISALNGVFVGKVGK